MSNKKKKDTVVYISGPITGVENYMENFEIAEQILREEGYEHIINPAKIGALLPTCFDWITYMSIDLTIMKHCDAVAFIPGWSKSKGCQWEREMTLTMETGMEVIELHFNTREKQLLL